MNPSSRGKKNKIVGNVKGLLILGGKAGLMSERLLSGYYPDVAHLTSFWHYTDVYIIHLTLSRARHIDSLAGLRSLLHCNIIACICIPRNRVSREGIVEETRGFTNVHENTNKEIRNTTTGVITAIYLIYDSPWLGVTSDPGEASSSRIGNPPPSQRTLVRRPQRERERDREESEIKISTVLRIRRRREDQPRWFFTVKILSFFFSYTPQICTTRRDRYKKHQVS